MTKQNDCSDYDSQTNLLLMARAIVVWVGEQAEEGEEVGGIGVQIQRAARLLRLPEGVVLHARHRRSGPEICPVIFDAHEAYLVRRAEQEARARRSPWRGEFRVHRKPAHRVEWEVRSRGCEQS